MPLTVEKGIRGGIYHSIYQYAKANNKHMKDYEKIKNRHIFSIGMHVVYMVGKCRISFR